MIIDVAVFLVNPFLSAAGSSYLTGMTSPIPTGAYPDCEWLARQYDRPTASCNKANCAICTPISDHPVDDLYTIIRRYCRLDRKNSPI